MGEVVIPKLGKKFGYVITRKYKQDDHEMRQIIAFYMEAGKFYVAQWCRNPDGGGDYKYFKSMEVSREEYFWNFYYEEERDEKVVRPARGKREKVKEESVISNQ